jgi:hypothetical protein
MSRARKYDTPAAIRRRLIEGCGAGQGAGFKPWFECKDVSSRGRRHRIRSIKFCRVIHLLSDLELMVAFIAEYLHAVIGLKEQVPMLPLAKTLKIATDLKKRHPRHPQTQHPVVMTTDQIWTLGTGEEIAINCKYSGDQSVGSNLAKFEIEEEFHATDSPPRPLFWVDETIATRDFVINWSFLRGLLDPDQHYQQRIKLASEIDHVMREWVSDKSPLQHEIVAAASNRFSVPRRDALAAIYHLIATDSWPVQISTDRLGPWLKYIFMAR